jgi:hypothetical protein
VRPDHEQFFWKQKKKNPKIMKCTITVPKQCNFHTKEKTSRNQFKSFRTFFTLLKFKNKIKIVIRSKQSLRKCELCWRNSSPDSWLSGLPTLVSVCCSRSFVKIPFDLEPWAVGGPLCLPGPADSPADSLGGGAHYRLICLPSLEYVARLTETSSQV